MNTSKTSNIVLLLSISIFVISLSLGILNIVIQCINEKNIAILTTSIILSSLEILLAIITLVKYLIEQHNPICDNSKKIALGVISYLSLLLMASSLVLINMNLIVSTIVSFILVILIFVLSYFTNYIEDKLTRFIRYLLAITLITSIVFHYFHFYIKILTSNGFNVDVFFFSMAIILLPRLLGLLFLIKNKYDCSYLFRITSLFFTNNIFTLVAYYLMGYDIGFGIASSHNMLPILAYGFGGIVSLVFFALLIIGHTKYLQDIVDKVSNLK